VNRLGGNRWTAEDVQKLENFLAAKKPFTIIAEELGRSVEAVISKINRLGLVVDDDEGQKNSSLSSSFADFPLPEDLPSIETQLRVLAGVIEKLQKGDLDKTDVMRLRGLISAVKSYKELFAEYVGYREIEVKVEDALEWLRKLDQERKDMETKRSAEQ
jgi:hypothetical protein